MAVPLSKVTAAVAKVQTAADAYAKAHAEIVAALDELQEVTNEVRAGLVAAEETKESQS